MRQLKPRAREGVGELVGVLVEPFGDCSVCGVGDQCQVGCKHDWGVCDARHVGIRSCVRLRTILRNPLRSARWALGLLPFIGEQEIKVAIVPSGWSLSPRTFETAGDCILGITRTQRILPTQTLFGNRGGLWLRTHVLTGVSRTVCFTKGVTTGDKSNGFFVVHRHASKGFANVAS